MHLASIAFAEADEESAWDFIDKARQIIEQRGLYLLKNLTTVVTNHQLLLGNRDAAFEWLARYASFDSGDIRLYELYQILTTIRARIAIGDFSTALVLITKTEKLALDYRRPLDQMELSILRAIVFWNEKQREDAVISMERAVLLAQPYGFMRIFANEGAVVIPILQKLYNRLSARPEQSDVAVFVRMVLLLANENAQRYPGLRSGLEEQNIRLSGQQKRMLLFLAAGKNNRQICAETGLKLNTVKAHLYKLYEKLEVHSSTEAVLKAYRLGILEKK